MRLYSIWMWLKGWIENVLWGTLMNTLKPCFSRLPQKQAYTSQVIYEMIQRPAEKEKVQGKEIIFWRDKNARLRSSESAERPLWAKHRKVMKEITQCQNNGGKEKKRVPSDWMKPDSKKDWSSVLKQQWIRILQKAGTHYKRYLWGEESDERKRGRRWNERGRIVKYAKIVKVWKVHLLFASRPGF